MFCANNWKKNWVGKILFEPGKLLGVVRNGS